MRPDTAFPDTAFKVLTAEQWWSFSNERRFTGAPVDLADGYIHLSTADQLEETISKHFRGQSGLIIAEVRLGDYGAALKWEESRGGALFPHLYAPLELSTIIRYLERDG